MEDTTPPNVPPSVNVMQRTTYVEVAIPSLTNAEKGQPAPGGRTGCKGRGSRVTHVLKEGGMGVIEVSHMECVLGLTVM
jgi:hypothetical protein